VCNNVADNVVISNPAATAGPWSIGDRNGACGGGALTIGNDLDLLHNASPIEVEDNSPAFGGNIGHDLLMLFNNGGLVAEANHAGHDCIQAFNAPYTNQDADNDGPNTADHSVGACNTPNS
jgi:hypothetical protein